MNDRVYNILSLGCLISETKMSNSLVDEVKEIYGSRSILKALVVKNLFGHYKNSVFGFAWHFFNPLVMLFVYYFAFSYIRHSGIENNWIYIASGLFVFSFILGNIVSGSGCIVSQAGMINKMYFPRSLIPLANVISTFIVALFGYLIIFVAIIISGFSLNPAALLFFPIILVLAFIFALGCILTFSSITVYIRDVQYFLGAISMVFFFLTPMYFLVDTATGILGKIIWLNPLTYYVEMCHDVIYWGRIPDLDIIITSVLISVVALAVGTIVFSRLKHRFAERV